MGAATTGFAGGDCAIAAGATKKSAAINAGRNRLERGIGGSGGSRQFATERRVAIEVPFYQERVGIRASLATVASISRRANVGRTPPF